MRQAVFRIYHHNCWTEDVSKSVPEVSCTNFVERMTEMPNGKKTLLHGWRVTSTERDHMTTFLDQVANSKKTRDFQILSESPEETLMLIRTDYCKHDSSVFMSVLKNDAVSLSPTVMKDQYEEWHIACNNPKQLATLLNELDDIGELKVQSIGKPITQKAHPITQKQKEALQIAKSYDYYKWPRRITLEELASIAKLSRRAFEDRLRRAESKLIPSAIGKLLLKR